MKKILSFVCILISVQMVVGAGDTKSGENVKLVTGKVVDKISGEEIAGAEVKINDKVLHTDLEGNFSVMVGTAGTEQALVSFISYNDQKINIDTHSYAQLVIELESK
ncbi:MAG: carboxypeptidase-like regulatory domain-containing protein [Bacteroidia bacterium]